MSPEVIKGKRILLKPNLVETNPRSIHINTHPLVVRGAAEAFLKSGASQVLVAEGPGHCRDTLRVFEESGLSDVLWEDRIPFIDLNYQDGYGLPNAGKFSRLTSLTFPATLRQVDLIVSLAKLKTHHWAGITLSMKNLIRRHARKLLWLAEKCAALCRHRIRHPGYHRDLAAPSGHCGRHCGHGGRWAHYGGSQAGGGLGHGA